MTQEQKQSRQKKSQLLEVKQVDPITYLVPSQSDPSLYYKVTLNGSNSCHCADFKKHVEADPAWTCKHIAAALDLKANGERVEARANGQGAGPSRPRFISEERARIQADIDLLFGAKSARQEKASAPQVLEETPAGDVPPKGAEPLDPCSECGILLPASEMIPWQAPNGSGLICQECHQAHKEIQSELKTQEETPAEPGILPQPAAHCALCGGEFPLASNPSLSCKSCESPRRDTLPGPQDNHGPTDSPPEIPEASRACPGPDPGTLTLAKAYPALTRPFPINLVEIKPGTSTRRRPAP